ncbi:hypothetical protein Hdeb2414_s0003g00104241 [Helianthus debilis subsp. tardiflorus]
MVVVVVATPVVARGCLSQHRTAVTTCFLEGGDTDRQNQDIDGVSKVRSIHLPSRWSKIQARLSSSLTNGYICISNIFIKLA